MRKRTDEKAAVYTSVPGMYGYARAYPATAGRSDNPIFDCHEPGRRPPPVTWFVEHHIIKIYGSGCLPFYKEDPPNFTKSCRMWNAQRRQKTFKD
ncbi:hypothetical protein G5I_12876 [Acromyrmex echinatior]|uniref:Uncharacterized protein n=1 Tax=Acromyrmex echinatior TaxID=103372 RepID=F4X3J3_ACREC|nr:hypothetical protein G5I_12876 [Acromyrmex echinatior]